MVEEKTEENVEKEEPVARRIVLPGDLITEKAGKKIDGGAYFEGDYVYSNVLGMPRIRDNEVSVVPLSGNYIPGINDRILGVISSVEIADGWWT